MQEEAHARVQREEQTNILDTCLSSTDSLRRIADGITALDSANRRDLSIPLRHKFAGLFYNPHDPARPLSAPHPVRLRKLEIEVAGAFAEHKLDTSAPETAPDEEFSLFFGRETRGSQINDDTRIGKLLISRNPHAPQFETHFSIHRSIASDFSTYIDLLQLQGPIPELAQDQQQILLRQGWLGEESKCYTLSFFNIPCELERNYVIHSAIEVHDSFSFADEELANEVASKLQSLQTLHNSAEVQSFARAVNKLGARQVLADAGVPASLPSNSETQALQERLGASRSQLRSSYMKVREGFLERCFQPGMTHRKLGGELKWLWPEVELNLL